MDVDQSIKNNEENEIPVNTHISTSTGVGGPADFIGGSNLPDNIGHGGRKRFSRERDESRNQDNEDNKQLIERFGRNISKYVKKYRRNSGNYLHEINETPRERSRDYDVWVYPDEILPFMEEEPQDEYNIFMTNDYMGGFPEDENKEYFLSDNEGYIEKEDIPLKNTDSNNSNSTNDEAAGNRKEE